MNFFDFFSSPKYRELPRKERSRLDLSLKEMTANGSRVLVTSNLMATFSCPNCNKSRQQDISKFIEHETQVKLKCKCSCQHTFSVILERRRSVRKEKFFHGHMVEVHTKGYVPQKSIKSKILIKNLSMHGIRIKTLEKIPLKKAEIIKIEFKLNDPKRSTILREVRIKKMVSSIDIGCEFISNDHYGYLNKYFLFHF